MVNINVVVLWGENGAGVAQYCD